MNKKTKRLRYAPSPTGKLHIGGARTALLNYLFAKHYEGKFIIRTEDTDILRNIDNGEINQLENLEWLGVISDEDEIKGGDYGPYKQTKRIDIYNKYVDFLLEKKFAYKCWCTPEELERERKEQLSQGILSPKYSGKCRKDPKRTNVNPSIRIHIPKDEIFKWNDGVRGPISFPGKDIGDWVIRKSNGMPTYNFAVVIDDHLMKITDVLRGEEHISNTPKQIHLYKLFNWEIPNFYHLSIIVDKNKKKLSKRDEETLQFIHLYKEMGYLPKAIFNFLALLGWSPMDEEEIFNKEKLIEIFDEKRLSRAPSFFDINKLQWINNYYIKKLNDQELFDFLSPFVSNIFELTDIEKMEIFKIFQSQIRVGNEICNLIDIFVNNEKKADKKNIEFALENIHVIRDFFEETKKISEWDYDKIKKIINKISEKYNIRGKKLMMPIRIATTFEKSGPDIVSVLKIFGRKKVLIRIEKFLKNEN